MAYDPSKLAERSKQSQAPSGGYDPSKLAERSKVTITETPEQHMGEAGDYDFGRSARQTASHVYDNYIKQQLFPTTTSAAASKLPALRLLPKVMGPYGIIVPPLVEGLYQAGAGYLGEKLNQRFGITPQDEDEALLQGGIQGTVAGTGKGIAMTRHLAGRKGAVNMNRIAATEGRQLVQKYKPLQESGALFDQASAEGATVPMHNTRDYVNSVIRRVTEHGVDVTPANLRSKLRQAYGSVGDEIYDLHRRLQQNGNDLPASTWQWVHTRVGKHTGVKIKDKDTVLGEGEAKALYGHMLTDLEQVAEGETRAQNTGIVHGATERGLPNQGGPEIRTVNPVEGRPQIETTAGIPQQGGLPAKITPENPNPSTVAPNFPSEPGQGDRGLGATTLLRALKTYRREKSVERMGRYVEKANRILSGQGGDASFNASYVLNRLNEDPYYPKAFTSAERKEIEETMMHLNSAAKLPSPASVNAGSKRMTERVGAAMAGGYVAGVPGVAAGLVERDLRDFGANLAFAMKTQTGRAMVKELARTQKGFFTPRNLAVLSAYASALRHEPDSQLAQEQ